MREACWLVHVLLLEEMLVACGRRTAAGAASDKCFVYAYPPAIAFASGTAAISACIHLLNSGDHIVCMDDEYEGTPRFLLRVAKPVCVLYALAAV